MTTPGEGPGDAQHNLLTEEAYIGILDGLDEAGWVSGGGWDPSLVGVQIGIVRQEGRGSLTPEMATLLLPSILDEDGGLLPGYEVRADPETGRLALGYEGPADNRYQRFLHETTKLGHTMDLDLIEASAHPLILDQWRQRHRSWARRASFNSLDPSLDDDLKAVRDHVVFKENGLAEFQVLMEALVSPRNLNRSEELGPFVMVILNIREALETDEPGLDLVLQQADAVIAKALEVQETALLQDAPTAAAFLHEVLVEDPHQYYDSQPTLGEEEFQELAEFEDGPDRPTSTKLTLLAEFVYYSRASLTPTGMKELLDEEIDLLAYKTPRQVIDSGSGAAVETLINWRKGR